MYVFQTINPVCACQNDLQIIGIVVNAIIKMVDCCLEGAIGLSHNFLH